MSDNIILPIGTLDGPTVALDDIGGVKYPRSKITLGADGVNDGDVSSANPLPVTGTVTANLGAVDNAVLDAIAASLAGTLTVGTHGVTGTFWQATQPVSIAASVAVTGPLTDVQLRATPVPVSGTVTATTGGLTDTELRASAVPVSIASIPSHNVTNAGTFAVQASQSGTWTVGLSAAQTLANVTTVGTITNVVHIDDNSGSLTVDGTVTANAGTGTFAVSAASLPLPTGASTEAKQPAIGTAGTASLDVITVQGIASMTALKVDGSAVTQPVSGTVTATVGTVTAVTTVGTITNVVHIDDNGGAITVDGTVTVTNTGTFVTQIDGAALTSLQLIDNLVLAEDAAHVSGDPGIQMLAVQKNADAALNADGDYTPLQVDSSGFLKVNIKAGAGSGGTALTDDAAFTVTSTSFTPVGGVVTADSVDSGDGGAFAMLSNRQQKVTLYDSGGSEVAVGGGTQYIEGDTDATITGTVTMMEVAANTLQPIQGTVADGLLVNLGGNNDVTVTSGTITTITNVVHIDDNSSTISIDDGSGSITVDGTVGISGSVAVTGTFWQATQPVSGPLTDTQLRATPVPVSITGGGDATAANQTTIIGHVDGIEGLLTTIDADTGSIATSVATVAGAVSGTEMQVDVLTMPTVTVTGTVTANIGTVSTLATAAKQPALGTAGTASADVITVQGITSMTALKVDGSAVTQPVSGTVTANVGTVTAVTTVGTITNVVHIDDNASTISVDDGGGSLTVDGTVAVSGTVTVASHAVTNAGTFVVQVDGAALTSLQLIDDPIATIGGVPLNRVAIYDGAGAQITTFGGGTQYTEGDTDATITGTAAMMEVAANVLQPVQGTVADGLLVNLGSNNDVTVTGTVTANAGSGTFNIAGAVTNAGTFVTQIDGAALTSLQLIDDLVLTQGASDVAKKVVLVAGTDTSNVRPLLTDTSGRLQIAVSDVSGIVSLPTGASTAAKQPALGTAGTASSDVITVQGIASMTALKVDGSAVTQPVSGTVTANVGTVTAVTTVGTITNVVHIDDNASTISVDDGGGSLTVDGTVAVSGTVTVASHNVTNAGTFAVQVDGAALTSLQLIDDPIATIGGVPLNRVAIYDGAGAQITTFGGGTQYTEGDTDATITGTAAMMEVAANVLQPVQGTVADGLLVNLGANNDVTVTGTVTANAGSGTFTVAGAVTNTVLSVVGGGTEATAQRVTIASDSTGVLSVDDNGGSLTVDGTVAATQSGTWNIGTVTTLTGITNALPAGTNAIGKLAANSGVDIGDVDVLTLPAITIAAAQTLATVTTVSTVTTCSTVTTLTGGGVAHDGADSGNPHKIGAKAKTALSGITVVAADDRSDLYCDADGVLITRPMCPLGDIVSEQKTNTDGASTAFTSGMAAPGSGVRLCITTVEVANSSATDITVDIRDGSAGSVLWTLSCPGGGGNKVYFTPPLKLTANTALAFDGSAAATTLSCSALGFKTKL